MHKFKRIRQISTVCPHGMTHCRHLANTIEPSVYGGDAPYLNYFHHLLSLDTSTYTIAQIA